MEQTRIRSLWTTALHHQQQHHHDAESARAKPTPQLLAIVESLQLLQRTRQQQPTQAKRPGRSIVQRIRRRDAKATALDIETFLSKLTPFDFRRVEARLLDGYHEVRQWFFKHNVYVHWMKGKAWHLCCYGEARSGKTTFTAAIAREIRKTSECIAITLFGQILDVSGTFTLQTHPKMSIVDLILRTALRQIIDSKISAGQRSVLVDALSASTTYTIDTSLDSLRAYLLDELRNAGRCFILIDGMNDSVLATLAEELKTLSQAGCGILIMRTAAHAQDLTYVRCDREDCENEHLDLYWSCQGCDDFDLCTTCYESDPKCVLDVSHSFLEPYDTVDVSFRSYENEIGRYIKDQLKREMDEQTVLGRRLSNGVGTLAEVENIIAARAAGVFVLARLYMEYLISQQSIDDVINKLSHLPQFECDYFQEMIYEITQGLDRDVASAALAISAYADVEARPMEADEVVSAVQHFVDQRRIAITVNEERIIAMTNGFLMLQVNTSVPARTLLPFHEDASTFLHEECQDLYTSIDFDMAVLCLSVLCKFMQDINKRKPENARIVLEEMKQDAFLKYAWQHWGLHLQVDSPKRAHTLANEYLDLLDMAPFSIRQVMHLLQTTSNWTRGWPVGTSMHVCAHFGLLDMFKQRYSKNVSSSALNIHDEISGATPLLAAVWAGQYALVQELLNRGADVTIADRNSETAITAAIEIVDKSLAGYDTHCIGQSKKILSSCLDALDNINRCPPDGHLLSIALLRRQTSTIELILARPELDLTWKDTLGRTFLHTAIEVGCIEFLDLAPVQHEIKLRCIVDQKDGFGRTALSLAVQSIESSIEKIHALEALVALGADLKVVTDHNQTLLHLAADDMSAGVTEYLLRSSIPIDAKDEHGLTALHVACACNNVEVVKLLLSHGVQRQILDLEGRDCATAARICNSTEVLTVLEDAEKDVPASDSSTTSHICQLIYTDADNCLEMLQAGSIAEEQLLDSDPLRFSALHASIQVENADLTQLLLDTGQFRIADQNIYGDNSLHLAVRSLLADTDCSAVMDIVDTLLEVCDHADIEVVDRHGKTVLQLLADGCQWELCFRLIEMGAEITLCRQQIQQAYDQAVFEDRTVATERLLQAGADPLCRRSIDNLPADSDAIAAIIAKAQDGLLRGSHQPS